MAERNSVVARLGLKVHRLLRLLVAFLTIMVLKVQQVQQLLQWRWWYGLFILLPHRRGAAMVLMADPPLVAALAALTALVLDGGMAVRIDAPCVEGCLVCENCVGYFFRRTHQFTSWSMSAIGFEVGSGFWVLGLGCSVFGLGLAFGKFRDQALWVRGLCLGSLGFMGLGLVFGKFRDPKGS